MTQFLRCFAQRQGNRWHAICVDFDVAADGATLEEAKVALAACVELYLEAVEELPADERHRAMARRAPLHVRVKLAFLAWLQGLRGHHATTLAFVLDFPAPIAVHA